MASPHPYVSAHDPSIHRGTVAVTPGTVKNVDLGIGHRNFTVIPAIAELRVANIPARTVEAKPSTTLLGSFDISVGQADMGESLIAPVLVATAAALPACTAAGAGAGHTLTADAVGILTVDGVALVLNDRVLVKNQVAVDDNGVYRVSTAGTAGVAFVLTRATDHDSDAEVSNGDYVFATSGTANAGKGFVLTAADPITVDTTNLTWTSFGPTVDVSFIAVAGASV